MCLNCAFKALLCVHISIQQDRKETKMYCYFWDGWTYTVQTNNLNYHLTIFCDGEKICENIFILFNIHNIDIHDVKITLY